MGLISDNDNAVSAGHDEQYRPAAPRSIVSTGVPETGVQDDVTPAEAPIYPADEFGEWYDVEYGPYIPEFAAVDEEYSVDGWTWRRVIYLLIALAVIAALVVYFLIPLIDLTLNPPPPPPMEPPVQL